MKVTVVAQNRNPRLVKQVVVHRCPRLASSFRNGLSNSCGSGFSPNFWDCLASVSQLTPTLNLDNCSWLPSVEGCRLFIRRCSGVGRVCRLRSRVSTPLPQRVYRGVQDWWEA